MDINTSLPGELNYCYARFEAPAFICVNNCWCTISKEVSSYCSPEVEYLMINCRPHYIPREFLSVCFVTVYIPPQSAAGTKTALNELYSAISKPQNAHPEAEPLVAGDLMQGNLNLFYQMSINMLNQRKTRGKRTLDYLYSTHRDAYKALPHTPFGKSDQNYILLIPTYKQKIKAETTSD